jgi:hypothetical protein
MNALSSVDFKVSANPIFCVVVTGDAVFLSGRSWRTLSTISAGLLQESSHVVSSTGNAMISGVESTNYTGGIREIFAEPFVAEEAEEDAGRPSLFSKLPHTMSLLVATRHGGDWTAASRNVKKIVTGDCIVAMPPITPAIRELSINVRFPDREVRSVVIARVTAIRDAEFSRRPMKTVSFSGSTGIVCDGLMLYVG